MDRLRERLESVREEAGVRLVAIAGYLVVPVATLHRKTTVFLCGTPPAQRESFDVDDDADDADAENHDNHARPPARPPARSFNALFTPKFD